MDSELDGSTSSMIEQHLDGCPACLKHLHEFKGADGLVHGLPKIDPGPDFARRVISVAILTSDVASRETVPFAASLKRAVTLLSEAVLRIFEPGTAQSTHTLDEFSDCPPLSMSFVYFKLLEQGSRGY